MEGLELRVYGAWVQCNGMFRIFQGVRGGSRQGLGFRRVCFRIGAALAEFVSGLWLLKGRQVSGVRVYPKP